MENAPLNDSYLMEKKFEFMLESINKKVANELNSLKTMIGSINSEVTEIKKQPNNAPRAAPAVFESSNSVNNQGRDTPTRGRSNEPVKPRFGDYNPEDVPIEKFFYFGNKR